MTESFRDSIAKTLQLAMKMKQRMQEKGLKRARAKCPECPGKYLHASINGPKNHIHFRCECGKRQLME